MTVIENLTPRKQYTYITGKQNYDITFPYIEKSYVKCMINDTLLTYPTQYEVPAFDETSLSTNQLQVVLKVTPTAGDIITIYRDTPIDQQTEFPQEARFSSQKITEALDKLTQLNQEQADDISQCLRLAKNLPEGFNTMLPFPEANQVIQWNEDGTQLINYDLRGEIAEFEEEVEDEIDEIEEKVNTANTNASSALDKATTALSNSSSAVSTANNAETKANNAVSTANDASSTASNALSTANNAANTASSASSTANTAATNASSALSKANNALSTANNADSIAGAAMSKVNQFDIALNDTTDGALKRIDDAITLVNQFDEALNDTTDGALVQLSTGLISLNAGLDSISAFDIALNDTTNGALARLDAGLDSISAFDEALNDTTNGALARLDAGLDSIVAFGESIDTVIGAASQIYDLENAINTATNAAEAAEASVQEALDAIESVGQVDWNETDDTSRAYINNKPTIPNDSIISSWGYTKVTDTVVGGWGYTKTTGTVTSVNNEQPDANGNVTIVLPDTQVQADWNETDTDDKAYIKNKPTIPTVPTALSSFTDDLGSNPTHTHSQYLKNKATGNGSLSILGDGTLTSINATCIGDDSNTGIYGVSIGNNADSSSGSLNICIGYSASIQNVNEYSSDNNILIGSGSYILDANYAIQLGKGNNTTSRSFNVGFGTLNNVELNYQLLDGTTGLIPDARLNLKTINGNSIKGTGNLTVSGLPSQTGNSGKLLTTDGTDASWSDLLSLGAVQTSDLTEVICLLSETTSGDYRLRTWSNGLKELWCADYTQSTAGAYNISYPSGTFTDVPLLIVDYHLAATASTSTTVRNYGYSRGSSGFTVYLAANAHISFYARGY